MSYKSKIKKIALLSMIGIMTATMLPVKNTYAKSNDTYFKYSLKVKKRKTKTYDSRIPLELTKINAKGNATVSLKEIVINGKKTNLKKYYVSCDYIAGSNHIASLTNRKSSLKINIKLLKSIAGTKTEPNITIRKTKNCAETEPVASAMMNDTEYKKDLTGKTVNVKYGQYGTKKIGFFIGRDNIRINNVKKNSGTYEWWISQYVFRKGKWTASDFIIIPKSPYGTGDTAYHFSVNRDRSNNLTGMTLSSAVIKTADSYETWVNQTNSLYPEGWYKGKKFNYSFALSDISDIRLSSESGGIIDVQWKSDAMANGYRIECSRKKNFTLSRIQKLTGSESSKVRLEGLHSGEKYYIRIRSNGNFNGKEYQSPWSKTKTIFVK